MKAMIFAAGLGTRLRPLTNDLPKALIKIKDVTLLELTIKKLNYYGFNEIIINIHHWADKIIDFLQVNKNFGLNIVISDESDLLLDTGGGLKKTAWFFNDNQPFLIHNVDIISDINLKELYQNHLKSSALVTLAVSKRQTSRYFLFDKENNLAGWQNLKTNEEKISTKNKETKNQLTPLAFSGIQVINPQVFSFMPEEKIFSITDFYLTLAENHQIKYFDHTGSNWLDVGKLENIKTAEEMMMRMEHESMKT